MGIKIKIKTDLCNLFMMHLKRGEIKKFKDKRRKEIYTKTDLSKKQKESINKFFKENYGKKVPFTWHKYYTSFTGNFDVRYIPEMLYIPEFEFFENSKREYAKVIEDKNILPIFAKYVDVYMPSLYVQCINGILKNNKGEPLSGMEEVVKIIDNKEVFIKPSVDSNSGHGCKLLNIRDGIDMNTGKSCKEILTTLGENYLVQEKIICHKSLRDIYDKSVNTFRVITYLFNGKVWHMPVILRIGQGGAVVDNAHAGGMFIAVDDNGDLHKTAFTEFNKRYDEHPDTKLKYESYNIPNVKGIIDAAYRMHNLIPQLGCINWDFTLNEECKPVLIEANVLGGSIWLPQIAHGKGAFGDNTEDILKWIRENKKKNYNERIIKHLSSERE